MTADDLDRLRALLIRRGPWGVVPSDLPAGVTLDELAAAAAAAGDTVRHLERDGVTPALRRVDGGDQRRERREADRAAGVHRIPVNAQIAAPDGFLHFTGIEIRPTATTAQAVDERSAA